jgi:hypothetical protein
MEMKLMLTALTTNIHRYYIPRSFTNSILMLPLLHYTHTHTHMVVVWRGKDFIIIIFIKGKKVVSIKSKSSKFARLE